MSVSSDSQSKRSETPFQARGFTPKVDVDSISNGLNKPETSQKTQQFTNISSELTRNSNYIVSQLSANPIALKNSTNDDFTGFIDENTGHSLLVSNDVIYAWNYNSVDGIPETIQLPIIPSNNGFIPLTLLVSPSAGSSEPGVVVINSHTGHIRFYEDIENASSIGLLQHHKGIEYLLKLYDREIITLTESIEPAGVLLSTNQGRLVLVSLRDSTGKPSIRTSEIIGRQLGFFSSTLSASKHITSIKAGTTLSQGERVAVIATSGADFQIWLCTSDGQTKRLFQSNLFEALTSTISELYPNSADSLEVLDLALLPNFQTEDVFLLLTSFQNGPNEFIYNLFTIRKEGDHLHIFSAYKINTFTRKTEIKPKLYVPSPYTTAFIVFENAIVLTELITKLEHTLNLRRKWEDIITFRDNVKIIGSGMQNLIESNEGVVQNPSVLTIIPTIGVLRIDRLNSKVAAVNEPTTSSFLKSHIEQAVFYGENQQNPIEFDLPEELNLSSSDIENDLLQAADEILISTSQYLPPRLLSTENHLALRKAKLEKLLNYTSQNFKDKISDNVKLILISILEKVTGAYHLQLAINSTQLEKEFDHLAGNDKLSDFLFNGLHNFNEFLTQLLRRLNSTVLYESVCAFVVTSVYSSILEVEKKYRFDVFELDGNQSGVEPFWFTSNEVYLLIDEIFEKFATTRRSSPRDVEVKDIIVSLSEILFYQSQQSLVWLKNQTPKSREVQEQLSRVQAFYEARSGVWTKTLVIFDAKKEALAIAETYEDLKSLVEISVADRENSKGEELKVIDSRFDYYFNKFGYKFAETLYKNYIYTGNYRDLLLEFKSYGEYLTRFFNENSYGKISWIKDICESDYEKASRVLLEVSQKTDENLSNKSIQLSISKLAALASIENEQLQPETDELLNDIQEELNFIDAQSAIFDQVHDFIRSDSDPTAQIDNVVKDLLKPIYLDGSFKLVKKTFERSLARLLSNKSLTVNELVDIFSLLNNTKTQNKLNYYYALKVLHLSTLSEPDKRINEKLIWKRAILSDDWKKIIGSDNKSDSFIQSAIQGTIIFETLLNYFRDGLYIANNDYNISLPDIKKIIEEDNDQDLLHCFQYITERELNKFKGELKEENDLIFELYSHGEFDKWIKALIGAANEQSGVNKVINYNTMVIES